MYCVRHFHYSLSSGVALDGDATFICFISQQIIFFKPLKLQTHYVAAVGNPLPGLVPPDHNYTISIFDALYM